MLMSFTVLMIMVRKLLKITHIVTLPEGRFTLQGEQLVQFHAVIDPFQEREDYGIDLYLSVLELITNMAQRMTTLVNFYIYCVSK